MKVRLTWVLLFLFAAILAFAQTPQQPPSQAPAKPPTISSVLDRSLTGVEREFVGAADVMPEDKYSFAPTNGEFKGVRNFAEQVKHVAATNNLVSFAILGQKPPAGADGDNGPADVKSKADIMKYLRDSFAVAHRAIATLNEQNAVESIKSPFGPGTTTRLGMSTLIVGHCFDHYGQMVEYLRMNGIIPPASRK